MTNECRTVLRVTVGSHMFGTATPTSDTDSRAVVVTSLRETLSPFRNVKVARQSNEGENDITEYELRHFVQLVTKGNPTLIETLFSPLVEVEEPPGTWLRARREALLDSRAIYEAHRGYVVSHINEAKKERPSRPRGKLLSSAIIALAQADGLLRERYVDPTLLLDGSNPCLWRGFHRVLKSGDDLAIVAANAYLAEALGWLDRTYETFSAKVGAFTPDYERIDDFICDTYRRS